MREPADGSGTPLTAGLDRFAGQGIGNDERLTVIEQPVPEIAHDHVSASASKPPPIKRQQNLTAGQSELDQNYSNSITPTEETTFSTPSVIRVTSSAPQ